MAYEKQTWECGETITADKLNHMEDGIEEASGGGTDVGYECTETRTVLTEESVTTVVYDDSAYAYGDLAYVLHDSVDAIIVTFNGTEYECSFENGGYGAPWDDSIESFDWSDYPFSLSLGDGLGVGQLATPMAGTYSIKVEAIETSVETTPCFRKAVGSVVSNKTALFVTGNYFSGVYDKFSHSVQEIFDVIANHGIVMVSITNSASSDSHGVYTPYLIETVNGDATGGVFGDISKVYFQNALDNSIKISATITNGEDVWAAVS